MKSKSFTFGEQTAAWQNRQKVTRENTVRSDQCHPDKSRQRVCWTLICGQDEHRVPFLWPCPAFLRLSISSVHQIHTLTHCSNTHSPLSWSFFCHYQQFGIHPLLWEIVLRNHWQPSGWSYRSVCQYDTKWNIMTVIWEITVKVVFRGWILLAGRGPSHQYVVH